MRDVAPSDAADRVEVSFSISPAALLKLLCIPICLLGIGHALATPVILNDLQAADGFHVRLAQFFMMQREKSAATGYSVALILLNVTLLVLNAVAARRLRTGSLVPWLFLAAIFYFLAMDEMLEVHEMVGWAIAERLNVSKVISFPWLLTGVPVTALIALSFVGFLRRLPPRARKLFLISGGIYVGGALGMELIESMTFAKFGFGALFHFEVLIEECMEMFGMALFAYALLDHLAQQRVNIRLLAA